MNIILFDDESRNHLLPFTFTRPVADIRIGILTIREKWEFYFKQSSSSYTQDYLSEKFPLIILSENIFINGSILPNLDLVNEIKSLQLNQAILYGNIVVAACLSSVESLTDRAFTDVVKCVSDIEKLNNTWDIFSKNDKAIRDDFALITKGRKSENLSATNKTININDIFIEEGAVVECAVLNASTGPIYIGKDAEVMEGSLIRGPFALCEHAATKLGTKVYGATTVGPYSKIGGEVSNSVIFGYSNKGHDGFLGNSVLGEWCNLGADTNNSNLKNNYSNVDVWSYVDNKYISSNLQFCGLMMGDHSKCGINTMFNTGTVVGVNANIFGSGFPPKFIPSYSWGGADGFVTYTIDKAFEVANKVLARRDKIFNEQEKAILTKVFELDANKS